jgi:hypothetical protein
MSFIWTGLVCNQASCEGLSGFSSLDWTCNVFVVCIHLLKVLAILLRFLANRAEPHLATNDNLTQCALVLSCNPLTWRSRMNQSIRWHHRSIVSEGVCEKSKDKANNVTTINVSTLERHFKAQKSKEWTRQPEELTRRRLWEGQGTKRRGGRDVKGPRFLLILRFQIVLDQLRTFDERNRRNWIRRRTIGRVCRRQTIAK